MSVSIEDLAHEISMLKLAISVYDTGWINTNDWTNRALGSTALPKNTDSYVVHNLNCDIDSLIIQVYVTSDPLNMNGNNTWLIGNSGFYWSFSPAYAYNVTVYQQSKNEIRVQTGNEGMFKISTVTGGYVISQTDDWYYKVKVWKIGA
jgi:hypothetical protein